METEAQQKVCPEDILYSDDCPAYTHARDALLASRMRKQACCRNGRYLTHKACRVAGSHVCGLNVGITKVIEGLYISNFSDSRNPAQLRHHGITHILSIHNNAQPKVAGFKYLCVHADDSPHQKIAHFFGECIEFIHRARANSGRVLVHCVAGVSRSVTIVTAYLLAVTQQDLTTCLNAVRCVRKGANPNYGFHKQLKEWNKSEKRKWKEMMKRWPSIEFDDHKKCTALAEAYKEWQDSNEEIHENPVDNPDTPHIETSVEETLTKPTDSDKSGSEKLAAPHTPIIMGSNTSSLSQKPKKEQTKMEKVRAALRSALNKSTVDKNGNKKYKSTDGTWTKGDQNTYYNDNITRASTLPASNIKEYSNGECPTDSDKASTLQARILPAYKIGNYERRQRHVSSPSHLNYATQNGFSAPNTPRMRTSSASSNVSRRYSACKRATPTHIPEHLDKKLVRSRSVGVLSNFELKMHRTASASVVKMDECEEWII